MGRVRDILYADFDFVELDNRGNRMYSAGLNNYYRFASGENYEKERKKVIQMDMPLPPTEQITITQSIWKRSNILKIQALAFANYSCEIDKKHESFIAENSGKPYMEGHHAIPMRLQGKFNQGLDIYANIICLCPLCHRKIHYGVKAEKVKMMHQIYEERAERLANSGLDLGRKEFTEIILDSLSYVE